MNTLPHRQPHPEPVWPWLGPLIVVTVVCMLAVIGAATLIARVAGWCS